MKNFNFGESHSLVLSLSFRIKFWQISVSLKKNLSIFKNEPLFPIVEPKDGAVEDVIENEKRELKNL